MDKAKKKRLKKALTWAGIAALVALLAVMPLLAKNEAAEDGPVASVLSAQVTREDVPLVLRGGGTLVNQGEQDVNIPTGVKITEFLVKNGDFVISGEPVARVDTLSVMEAITGVSETMDFLREEMEENRNEKVDSQVTATAGGRVKAVFARQGDSVQNVMLEHGALALLSIDGLMAVKLDADVPLTTGQSVEVELLGNSVTGRVESNLSGQIVITIADAGYIIGDTVTVMDEEGREIGRGELYVHNAWKAVAYSGTVDTVSAKPEQVLSSGATLFTLTDTSHKAQLNHRASQHREYEALLQKLLTMYESGYITAPCDGVVSGVDEDSVHLLSGENTEAEVTLLGDWSDVQLLLLTSVCTGKADCTAATHIPADPNTNVPHECINSKNLNTCPAPSSHNPDCIESCVPTDPDCKATRHQAGCASLCAGDAGTSPDKCPNGKSGNHKSGCIYRCSGKGTATDVCASTKNHYLSCIGSCKEAQKETDTCPATGTHKDNCIRSCVRADTTGICRNGPHYVDCIRSCTEKPDCPATKHTEACPLYGLTYTAKVAKVDAAGTTELVVYWDASGVQYPVEKTASGWAITGGQFNESLLVVAGTLPAANAQSFQKGDIVLSVTGTRNGSVAYQDVVFYKAAAPSAMAGFGSMNFNMDLSGMMGGFSGYGSVSAEVMSETENLYDLKGNSLLTVTPDEGIEVEILLDERDIAKVSEGMEATIRVEALRGQEFSGAVARVGAIGEHSGSTGKFIVRVEADSIPDSLPGMSSTVTIHREIREDVLTLPVAAVSQDGAKTIVYTALDSKTGKPSNPQVITTGVSDGENVEVFGLEEGATVYYLYYDVLELDHTARERQFNMN